MKVMILAAGRGDRMRPLTDSRPKPLLEVAGKPLIQHHIEHLSEAGFREIIINHAWLGEQIELSLGDGSQFGVQISYSAEGKALETAGGIIKALPLLGEAPFALVNGDIWTRYPFRRLSDFSGMKELAHLVMVDNPPHHPAGDYVLGQDGKMSVANTAEEKQKALTYSGIAVFSPVLFRGLEVRKRPLAPLLAAAMNQTMVSGEYFQGEWLDIGTVERLEEINRRMTEEQN